MSGSNRFDYFEPQWCPGCGNFSVLECLKGTLADSNLTAKDFIMVTGIGQAGKMGFSVKCNLYNGLHGRALPVACGIALANHKVKLITIAGDGDLYSEGGNHLIHNARRNLNITVLAGDNRVYGLTQGQASPRQKEINDPDAKYLRQADNRREFRVSLAAQDLRRVTVAD